MSKPTTFSQVRSGIANFGDRATLITVGDDGRPHVVTSLINADEERLTAAVGGRSRANLVSRPFVTLVWHPNHGDEYQLIVDGTVDALGEPNEDGVSSLRINVDGAIQHRLAGVTSGSSCRAADAR